MSTFVWVPDQGLSNPTTARVQKAQFGDGYSQRSSDGINNIDEKPNLSFSNRTRVEIDEIDAFLREHAGVSNFDYTVHGSEMKKYICESWLPVYNHDTDNSLTATFERVYEL